jgi:hypothetical protein
MDSNAWVDHSIHIQKNYLRVLAVDASDHPPRQIQVSALRLNATGGDRIGSTRTYRIWTVFKTLQKAADAAQGGDLIAVMPGTYEGFVLEDEPSARDNRYIHFEAMGRPGDVIINRASSNPDWMILLHAAHHVIIQGFNLAGHNAPGHVDPSSPRAGIMLDGDFGVTGREAHHIVILDNFSHNHRKWGLHSRDTHTVLIQGNLFALSAMEHSAYVSDGSDNYVIRRNIFFGSNASGLQCNLDTVSSFHDLVRNPLLRGYRKEEPTREWALGLIKLATEKFGENNFPDGKGINFIIEDNVINENGRAGGGSLNLAGLQDSLVQNNLIYGNFNHGIAQWGDDNPYDRGYIGPGSARRNQITGPADLPLWGCHGNRIRNNTVLMNNEARVAMQCRDGSWGTTMRNNIFINGTSSSIQVDDTSIYHLNSSQNVINKLEYVGVKDSLASLATTLPEGSATILGITQEKAASQFVRAGNEPWVIIEGNWWRLNPDRPDFRPENDSTLFAHWGDAADTPRHDLSGRDRIAPSIGAYAPAEPAAAP